VDPDSAAALRAGAQSDTSAIPKSTTPEDWISQVVPTNPFAAAANGAMLALVVFALLFGFAAARIPATTRVPLLGFFQGIADTMFVIVRWVLWLAPLGVFVLAFGVGFRGGISAAGAVAQYLVLMSALCVVAALLMYPLAVFGGHVSLARFARAAAPAQVVAFSTQSSLACLPIMLDAARSVLNLPPRVTAIALPLAVALFRITSPIVNVSIVIFVAHVHGVHLGAPQLVAGVAVAAVTSLAVVGLPSQITFFTTTVPISLAMGVPIEVLPLLLAVEVIPDLFRTIGNVTADLAVTAVAARGFRETGEGTP
jgi:Na+/H+-dicarboxylate symporter